MKRALLIVTFLASGCANPASPTPEVTSPAAQQLRLTLIGTSRLDGLIVWFPADRVSFGAVEGGTTTTYRSVPNGVYRYSAYQYTLDGVLYQQPVIDWVGERPMAGRAFTYAIEVMPAGPFRIKLVSVTRDH